MNGRSDSAETDGRKPAKTRKAAPKGNGGLYRRGRTWWLYYSYRGEQFRESAKTQNKTEAGRKLRERLAALDGGRAAPE